MDSAQNQLIDRIRAAAADRTPLRIRGAGSKDFYGRQLQGELLETRGLCGIVSYEPSELVVTVRAGTPLVELEAALDEKGQCLPFEPPRFGMDAQGTVGGMVAAGLSGPARASVGAVRDYVLGVEMVNGRAEPLAFGGQVIKNVAGYDVSRLMAGSMGTLGVLTQVSLKVLSTAPAEATLVFEMTQAQALAQINRWGGEPLPLNASCWVAQDTAQRSAGESALDSGREQVGHFYVRLRGAVAAVSAATAAMRAQCGGSLMDPSQAHADWALQRDMRMPFFTQPPSPQACLWRISVAQSAPVLNLPQHLADRQMVEWHGGLRWLWAPLSDEPQIHAAAAKALGYATVFIANYSIDTPVNLHFGTVSSPLDKIQRQLKAEFDPAGLFNRSRTAAEF